MNPLYSTGVSTGNGWIDNDLRRIVQAIQELQMVVQRLEVDMATMQDYVKYVDATAPELRTAYYVSKRIE